MRHGERVHIVGSAAVAPLALGSLVLLGDGLGTLLSFPGQVVGYMVAMGVLVGIGVSPWVLRGEGHPVVRRLLCLLPGLSLLVMAALPTVPVFASLAMVVGLCIPTLLAMTRGGAGRGMGYAGVAGAAGAVAVAAVWQDEPRLGLAVAGVFAAFAGAFPGPVPDSRRAFREVRWMLPDYAAVGWALGAVILPAARLLLFRFELFGADRMYHLLAAVAGGCVLAFLLGRLAGEVQLLLVVAAGGLLLVATAPWAAGVSAGAAVVFGAAMAALSRLDRLAGGRGAALTATAALLGGLGAYGAEPLLRMFAGSGAVLALSTIPMALLILWSVYLTPAAEAGGPPLALWRLSDAERSIDRLDLRAEAGEKMAFYGPGSQSLLRLLSGEARADGGRFLSRGVDFTKATAARRTELRVSHRVPAVPGDDRRTVAERLADLTVSDPWRVRAVLEVFPALAERRGEPAADLDETGALLLGLAEALLLRPRIVLVDARGCDPGLAPVLDGLAAGGAVVVLAEPPVPLTTALGAHAHLLRHGRPADELPHPTEEELTASLDRGRP
ncbi:P-loop NTPase family protein [Actinocorallia populi]|uniref:hypothetical protein n=1 Tax=Actinocorallia populi TaxID=2079200 RepID=UPI000D088DDD|nr:hypothetical protein [Actinocorallia populi]